LISTVGWINNFYHQPSKKTFVLLRNILSLEQLPNVDQVFPTECEDFSERKNTEIKAFQSISPLLNIVGKLYFNTHTIYIIHIIYIYNVILYTSYTLYL